MSYLEWSDEYSVGIRSMDHQHQRLVALLNDLYDAMLHGRGEAVMSHILDGLIDYTDVHFRAEEELMRLGDYPALDEHIREHEELTRHVVALQQELKLLQAMVTTKVIYFLQEWLLHHILETDMKYSTYLAQHGAA